MDGLKRQRLTVPLLKNSSGQLEQVEWEDALVRVAQALRSGKGNQVAALAGGLVDAEVYQKIKIEIYLIKV